MRWRCTATFPWARVCVSLLGLDSLITPIRPMSTTGGAALYVADPDVELHFTISANGEYAGDEPDRAGPYVTATIYTEPGTSTRWALVLTGAARLTAHHATTDGTRLETYPTGQVLSGVANEHKAGGFGGYTLSRWSATSAARTTVSLPTFGNGPVADLDAADERVLTRALGAEPRQPEGLDIVFDGGNLGLLRSLTSASPAPRDGLVWQSRDKLERVTYVIFDQGRDDAAQAGLFVLAILLGTAAACLVGAMQALVHVRTPR